MTLRWLSRLLSLLKLQWPLVDFEAIRIAAGVEKAPGADLALSAQPDGLGLFTFMMRADFSPLVRLEAEY
jgi:hypothetical protein